LNVRSIVGPLCAGGGERQSIKDGAGCITFGTTDTSTLDFGASLAAEETLSAKADSRLELDTGTVSNIALAVTRSAWLLSADPAPCAAEGAAAFAPGDPKNRIPTAASRGNPAPGRDGARSKGLEWRGG
jgi:hypothetical protein